MDDDIATLRAEIDALDRQLLDLLNRRATFAQQIGEYKQRHNQPVFRPEREREVIAKVQGANPGPLHGDGISAIWREIMSACRALEARQQVAFLGPEGTYSEQAARQFFGSSCAFLPCADLDEVFRSQLSGASAYAVVAIENSTEGAVARTLDLLLAHPVLLCGEISLAIHHNLLRKCAGTDGIQAVVAHPQALAQCRQWLDAHLPGIERRAVSSNAEGARLAAQDQSLAAIAGEQAASQYQLHTTAARIQDEAQNRTRFVVLGTQTPPPTGRDRTSLILSVPNRAGAVFEMLKPLAEHGVSMSRFESRPARSGAWEYFYYIDLEGHKDDPQVSKALEVLRQACAFYKNLGSYPIWKE